MDELVFNITPALEGRGLKLGLPEGRFRKLRLLELKDIGGGIIQVRYEIDRLILNER